MTTTAVLLAAGMGTRMRSNLPKALHLLGGRTMIGRLAAACSEAFDRVVIVVGPGMENVVEAVHPFQCVVQTESLGTAHAALQAVPLFGNGDVAVLYADNPLVTTATLKSLLLRRSDGKTSLALLAMRPSDPARYGRIVEEQGLVRRIVEWADATESERLIGLCNAGAVCASAQDLRQWLGAVRNANAKGEYYLTDVVDIAVSEGRRVVAVEGPESELRGVNSPEELHIAEESLLDQRSVIL